MRRLVSLLAALLLGSAAGVAMASGPASAAACPPGTGVTVVVGSSISCDANGGGQASDNFRDAGHSLTMVDRQPGFVCRVDGAPADASCVNTPPADAYWGLFWSDGTSGTWKYASQGVGSLSVPAGGWVGFAFQNSDSRKAPGVTPINAAAKPAPTKTAKPKPQATAKPTTKPAVKPTARTSTPTAAPSAVPTVTASTAAPTPTATKSAEPTPSATPSPSAAAATEPAPEASDDVAATSAASDTTDDGSGGSGSLVLVAGLLVLALIGAMGAVLWRRKAAGGAS